jgi:hypothetical protein
VTTDVLGLIGAIIGAALGVCALLGIAWKWVVLPNLSEHFAKVSETHKQVTENRHANAHPTILDRLEDIESSLDIVALNQLAVLRRLGKHIGESEADRSRLWLMVESLAHEDEERSKGKEAL